MTFREISRLNRTYPWHIQWIRVVYRFIMHYPASNGNRRKCKSVPTHEILISIESVSSQRQGSCCSHARSMDVDKNDSMIKRCHNSKSQTKQPTRGTIRKRHKTEISTCITTSTIKVKQPARHQEPYHKTRTKHKTPTPNGKNKRQ